jgi:hypothetical protein
MKIKPRYIILILLNMLIINLKSQEDYHLMNWKTQYTVRTY